MNTLLFLVVTFIVFILIAFFTRSRCHHEVIIALCFWGFIGIAAIVGVYEVFGYILDHISIGWH